MKITYNVPGKERKDLVAAISQLLGVDPIYMKTPTYAYTIGGYTVTRDGALITPDEATDDDVFRLVDALIAEYGFQPVESLSVLFPERDTPGDESAEEENSDVSPISTEAIPTEANADAKDDEEDGEGDEPVVGFVLHTEVTERDEEELAAKMATLEDSSESEADAADSELPAETPESGPEAEEAEPSRDAVEVADSGPESPDVGEEKLAEDTDATDAASDDEAAEGEDDNHLTLSLPRSKFPASALERLHALIASKETLLKKVLETDDISFVVKEDQILFPWFTLHGVDGEVDAYAKLIWALGRRALTASRINPKEKPTDNEKFTMRLFLNSLGFKGDDFKFARRFLIRNLEGDGAWRYGTNSGNPQYDLELPQVFQPGTTVAAPEEGGESDEH